MRARKTKQPNRKARRAMAREMWRQEQRKQSATYALDL
jgi:hypothetical protein